MNNQKIPPVHPGEILREDFMQPLRISQYRQAMDDLLRYRAVDAGASVSSLTFCDLLRTRYMRYTFVR